MFRLTLLVATFVLPALLHAQRTRALEQLASTMAGSYTSAEQAKTDTSYFEIELEMVRIWPKRRDGAWFYVEQATADSKAKPYRQRVYHVQEVNDSTFTSNILTIKGGELHSYGAFADPGKARTPEPRFVGTAGRLRHHPASAGNTYTGSTHDRDCPSKRGKAVYTTSEVVLSSDRMVSWDRGWDAEGQQAWGAEKGGYVFIKRGR
jgi:CpeT protein